MKAVFWICTVLSVMGMFYVRMIWDTFGATAGVSAFCFQMLMFCTQIGVGFYLKFDVL